MTLEIVVSPQCSPGKSYRQRPANKHFRKECALFSEINADAHRTIAHVDRVFTMIGAHTLHNWSIYCKIKKTH